MEGAMSDAYMTSQSSDGFNLDIDKIKKIVVSVATDPKNNWPVVQGEYGSIKSLYLNFLLPLLVLQAVVTTLHSSFIGINIPMYGVQKIALQMAIMQAVMGLVISCIMSFVGSIVLSKLAPKFGGKEDQLRALRLMTFTASLGCIASVLIFVPMVGMLAQFAVAIYSVYVFYQGITPMVSVPQESRLKYTVISVVIMIIVGLVVGMIVGPLMAVGTLATVS